MAQNTAIQWCDSTENPTMGCEGCELWNARRYTCYAGVLHRRFGGVSPGYSRTFDIVSLFPGRTERATRWTDLAGKKRDAKPWLNGLPRLIFVSDMSDALSESVSFDYLHDEIIQKVLSPRGQRHCWLWLTKRPKRMAEFSNWLGVDWPENLWVATSITTQTSTSRIDHIIKVGDERTIRFLSIEPQWESIDISNWLDGLDWVIQGGESGPSARTFQVEWAEQILDQCQSRGVPYFLKQLGSQVSWHGRRLDLRHSHGGNWKEWPRHLRVRDMPIPSKILV